MSWSCACVFFTIELDTNNTNYVILRADIILSELNTLKTN